MQQKSRQNLVFLVVLAVVLANSALGLADQNDFEAVSLEANVPVNQSVESGNSLTNENASENPAEETLEGLVRAAAEAPVSKEQEFLDRIQKELNLSKSDYRQLLNNISDAKSKLTTLSEEKVTLEQQLANLDQQVRNTTERLLKVIKLILEKENGLILLFEQIELKIIALEDQKNVMSDYIKMMYEDEHEFLKIDENGRIDAFKLLLADGTIGDNLRQLGYFDLLNEAGEQMMQKLQNLSDELQSHQDRLLENREYLANLKAELSQQKQQLQLQKESKQQLLKVTLGQEKIYNELLEQTLKQQEESVEDVRQLSAVVSLIQSRVKAGMKFDPKDYEVLLEKKDETLYKFNLDSLNLDLADFSWPITPDKGISAYFRDPGYAGFFGVQHNAIDIPAYQGSIVRAANDGVVYSTKDNGYGYSYIILAHADGFMTVYGHVTSILVKEGDLVTKGSIVALSGGMPGTLGSGYMTTGPHLHFELLLNGLYVDPLEHLPIDVFTPVQIEQLPEKYLDNWKEVIFSGFDSQGDKSL